jgi:hypothetical protein
MRLCKGQTQKCSTLLHTFIWPFLLKEVAGFIYLLMEFIEGIPARTAPLSSMHNQQLRRHIVL